MSTTTVNTVPIPQPPPRMVLGNLAELRRGPSFIESILDLAREYGGLFQLDMPLGRMLIASGPDIVQELCDDRRFDKGLGQGLLLIRNRIGDGLFTAYTWEPNWQKAHRIMMPPFSQPSMKAYMPGMVDIAFQLMEHLEKSDEMDVPREMTNLTLDTIALCGFSYRFDSFKRSEPHPFVQAMVEVLTGQQRTIARPAFLNKLMVGDRARIERAAQEMRETVDEIIRERRKKGAVGEQEDLLQHLLTGVDRKTGEGLPDENIRSQCITFLVAGHETTSGLLSFATYFLVKNPQVLEKAFEEVDRVLGSDLDQAPTYEQVHSLKYLEQILKESLRLWPTAPGFSRAPFEDTVVAGKYLIPKGQQIMVFLPALHREKSVWGEDADDFNPDHFAPEAEEKRPPNTFLPFGTGPRACIGRQFALQEAKLVLGMFLQRFKPIDFANYQMHVKQSLTIKPGDFRVKLEKRTVRKAAFVPTPAPEAPARAVETAEAPTGVSLQVLYGSNLGTGEGLANDLVTEAGRRGCPATAAALDNAVGRLTPDGVAVIICSSYNGTPPDNAAAFCAWLEDPNTPKMEGVRYAVFGCGNKEWATTYQAVPRRIDAGLEAKGATRVQPRGEGDAQQDLDGDFRTWMASLWGSLAAPAAAPAPRGPMFAVEVLEDLHPNPFAEVFEAVPMVLVENRELQNSQLSGRSTRHLELALPEGVTYSPGDHLGVIPRNAPALVERVAARFGLEPETRIRIHQNAAGRTVLPVGRIMAVGTVLTHYVELQETATRRHVEILAAHAGSPAERQALESMAEHHATEVRGRSRSMLDLLEDHPSVALPFGLYLELVSPLRPRYYSVSSSPLASGQILSVTVGVVAAPARSGHGEFRGTCSNYLASIPRGQSIHAFLQDTHGMFDLPAHPSTPIVMIGAGTGLAPFRGFLQERAAQKRAGKAVGPALLFFGCRHSEHDYLYREELEGYQAEGVVELVHAFSRQEPGRKVYVQDRVREHGDRLWQLLQEGAVIYVCGDAAGMSHGVRDALVGMVARQTGGTEEEAGRWLDQLASDGRYLLDVWASN